MLGQQVEVAEERSAADDGSPAGSVSVTEIEILSPSQIWPVNASTIIANATLKL